MFTITKKSIINIRSDTDIQNAKNIRKFEFRRHGLRITLKRFRPRKVKKTPSKNNSDQTSFVSVGILPNSSLR